jgi:hypothetical protein
VCYDAAKSPSQQTQEEVRSTSFLYAKSGTTWVSSRVKPFLGHTSTWNESSRSRRQRPQRRPASPAVAAAAAHRAAERLPLGVAPIMRVVGERAKEGR